MTNNRNKLFSMNSNDEASLYNKSSNHPNMVRRISNLGRVGRRINDQMKMDNFSPDSQAQLFNIFDRT